MKGYHSTLSRREFLKALGLGGAGLAAAAAAPPLFRDIDEVLASPQSVVKRPAWVREVDKPTVELDWNMMKRFNYYEVMWAGGFAKALGPEQADEIIRTSARNLLMWRTENKPGYTLADAALNGCTNQATISFLGPRTSATPQSLGMPAWQGTPEENARLVRAFLRIHGAAHVGFVLLETDTTEKLINAYDGAKIMSVQGPRLDILDVDQPEDKPADPVTGGGGYRVIPKKARSVIVYTLRMSPELIHRAPGLISSREHGYMYDLRTLVQGQLQNFLRTLGYMGLGDTLPFAAFCQSTGFAVLAGLGETCRAMHTLTPDFGLMERVFVVVTDLPLAPGKPIDFGVMNFCKKCKKCADFCPVKAIPTDTEPGWEINGPYNKEGVRLWRRNEPLCRAYIYYAGACAICFAVCPYSKLHKSSYTSAWQATVARTPAFNRLFRKMDDFMGYGARAGEDIEKFWDLELPPFGWT
jgi:epoxyqueuosine reductase